MSEKCIPHEGQLEEMYSIKRTSKWKPNKWRLKTKNEMKNTVEGNNSRVKHAEEWIMNKKNDGNNYCGTK